MRGDRTNYGKAEDGVKLTVRLYGDQRSAIKTLALRRGVSEIDVVKSILASAMPDLDDRQDDGSEERTLGEVAAEAAANPVEADSWDGVTIGIVEGIASMARVLRDRMRQEAARLRRRRERSGDEDWTWFSRAVQDAMRDLRHSPAMSELLYRDDSNAARIIRDGARLIRDRVEAEGLARHRDLKL